MKCSNCGHESTNSELIKTGTTLVAELRRANEEIKVEIQREVILAWQGLCESGQAACSDPED